MTRSRRRAAAAVLLPTLALLSTACGGSEDQAAPKPQESSSPSSSPTTESESPSATPTPKPSPSPLSRYEDEPPVVAARAFAEASARAVNRKQRDLAPAAQVLTGRGRQVMPALFAEDIDRDLYFPGPLPFTPVGVEVDGFRATVPACIQLEGFAQSRATKLPSGKRVVAAGTLTLQKVEGTWKVEEMRYRQGSCNDVTVKGVGW